MKTLKIYQDHDDSVDMDIDFEKRTCELEITIDQSYGSANMTVDISREKAKEIIKELSIFLGSKSELNFMHNHVINLEDQDEVNIGGEVHRLFKIRYPTHRPSRLPNFPKLGLMSPAEFNYYYTIGFPMDTALENRSNGLPIAYEIIIGE
jgi:hypothetical protein